ncbi:MAG: hypothetical protein KGJ02_04835 [Verrucomicrobiota bacterium]|nr:hypothetical protein [Verrucomicrobiota bacterium]
MRLFALGTDVKLNLLDEAKQSAALMDDDVSGKAMEEAIRVVAQQMIRAYEGLRLRIENVVATFVQHSAKAMIDTLNMQKSLAISEQLTSVAMDRVLIARNVQTADPTFLIGEIFLAGQMREKAILAKNQISLIDQKIALLSQYQNDPQKLMCEWTHSAAQQASSALALVVVPAVYYVNRG